MKKIVLIVAGIFLLLHSEVFTQVTIADSILSNGVYRSYLLYVPKNYNSQSNVLHPLVFNLHGYTSNASQQQSYSDFMPIADTAGFLMAYPQGLLIGGYPGWNAGFQNSPNDVKFISDLIDSLQKKYKIDPNSIYSCGMSMGGFMSYTLACALSNKIAAIASVTGTFSLPQYQHCSPNRAVPTMEIHGTADGVVAYTGDLTGVLPMVAIDTVVKYWVNNNKCNPTPVFTQVPDINILDGCTAEHYVYSGGIDSSSCELYKIIGGGHTWPGSFPLPTGATNEDFNASEKIWLFFRKYKLNQFPTLIAETSNESNADIYPNPCVTTLHIDDKNVQEVIIFDTTGRLALKTHQRQINISSLPAGVYSVVINLKSSSVTKKLVKL